MRFKAWWILAVWLGLYAPSAEGSQILIWYNESSLVCSGSVLDPDFSGAAPVNYSDTCIPSSGAAIGVNGEASLSTVRLSLNTSGPSQNSQSHITILDRVTVAGGTGNGTLELAWNVDGWLKPDNNFLAMLIIQGDPGGLYAEYRACGPTAFFLPCTSLSGDVAVNDRPAVTIPFTFGSPIDLQWNFGVGIYCNAMGLCPAGLNTGTNEVDFFNTAQLLPIIVRDSNGNPVSGASVLSESGVSYEIESSVPEPNSALLSGAGFALVFLLLRRTCLPSLTGLPGRS